MEAKTNYTMVGLAVIILTGALLASMLWLSVGFDKKKYSLYAVYIHEAVSGLNPESPVKYNGVQVGSVLKIGLSHIDPQMVKLLLSIEAGTPITTSTRATLISQGITGTTYVGLSANSSDLTPLLKSPGEPWPVIPAKPSLLNQLDKTVKEVADNISSLSVKVKTVFDEENTRNLKKSLANLQKFTHEIADHSKNIGSSLKNADELLRNLADASKNLNSKINRLTNEISNAGQNVSTTMRAGKTMLNKISQQTIPPAVVLIHQLNNIAGNLEKVSNELRQNPSIILRGTSPPPPGPGE